MTCTVEKPENPGRVLAQAKYRASAKGKVADTKYKLSAKGKVAIARHNASDAAKVTRRAAYAASPARRTAQAQYERTPKARAAKLARTAARRAAKDTRTPRWAERGRISCLYAVAGAWRLAEFDVHVDHQIPLRGKLVSGLHVLANLNITPATDNLRKANKWEIQA